MKKLYFCLFSLLVTISSFAQKNITAQGERVVKPQTPAYPRRGIQTNCNIINFPVDTSKWGKRAVYVFDGDNVYDSGFITGTNFYDDVDKAQYFDLSKTTNAYLSEALVGFADAYSTNENVKIPIKVYDGTSGSPGGLLGSASLTMKQIMQDVNDDVYSDVVFDPVITLPASKKFFVSVDLSNLEWYQDVSDTLAIYSSRRNRATGAWERYYNSATTVKWASFKQNYTDLDLALYIHPVVSETKSCTVLPVNLLSFNAAAKGKTALLNWQVAQESNMREYVVEKSVQGQPFAAVGSVAATNTPLQHAYSFSDADALASGDLLYYRLKQVDRDGKTGYSKTITLSPNSSTLSVKVVNPFKNDVQLQVNAPFIQKMQASIYDMQGRKILSAKEQVLSQGQNAVSIPTGSLPKGVYMLHLTVGKTEVKYKIVN